MNIVATTGGMSLGAPYREMLQPGSAVTTPSIDLFAVPARPVRMDEWTCYLKGFTDTRGMVWHRYEVHPEITPFMREMKGVVGVAAVNDLANDGVVDQGRVCIRFTWHQSSDPLTALAAVSQHENGLHPALAVAVFSAALLWELLPWNLTEEVDPRLVSMPSVLAGWFTGMKRVAHSAMSADEIRTHVRDVVLPRIAETGEVPARTLAPGGVNVATSLLALSAEVWNPRQSAWLWKVVAKRIAYMMSSLQPRPLRLAELAAFGALVRNAADVYVHGAGKLKLYRGQEAPQWLEMLALSSRQADEDVIALANQYSLTLYEEVYDKMWGAAPISDGTFVLLEKTLAQSARERRQYVPAGRFLVRIPQGLTWLRKAGFRYVAVVARDEGLWLTLLDDAWRRTPFWWWSPEEPLPPPIALPPDIWAMCMALGAALWHDLAVAGPLSFVEADSERSQPAVGPGTLVTVRRKQPTREIGGVRVKYEGRWRWGDDVEEWRTRQAQVKGRGAHQVRGFLRELPTGWHVGSTGRESAFLHGIVLPDGYTFVRPHVRGRGEIVVPTVRSHGLATLVQMVEYDGAM
jgi:hypothetical protein